MILVFKTEGTWTAKKLTCGPFPAITVTEQSSPHQKRIRSPLQGLRKVQEEMFQGWFDFVFKLPDRGATQSVTSRQMPIG